MQGILKTKEVANPLSGRVRDAISAHFPDRTKFVEVRETGDIEIAVRAPVGSKAGHLVVATQNGKDLWIRFSPPRMAYSADDEVELVEIVKQLFPNEPRLQWSWKTEIGKEQHC